MPMAELLIGFLGIAVVALPLLLLVFLGVESLLEQRLAEATISQAVQLTSATGLACSALVLAAMLMWDTQHVVMSLGDWAAIPAAHAPVDPASPSVTHGHYHFTIKFVFDRLSVPFLMMTYILCGVIGAFAARYMHRERGFSRFFLLYSIFMFGMVLTSLAGTIEVLFAGWELVGLSSVFLIGFFHERPNPVMNGLHVWSIYRISDGALLVAAVVLHHLASQGDLDLLVGGVSWPEGHTGLDARQSLIVGSLLLFAAAGKSALAPFCGWLPRAMEGPTPSSAVFYGALSVHLGAYLLLRISPLLDASPTLSWMVLALGLVSAIIAAFVGSVQSDIKTALSFASLTQVGLIVAEIGWGWRYLALVHIIGHASLRTLQFLRAPTLLHDYRVMENAIGTSLPSAPPQWDDRLPAGANVWLYRLAIERGYLDLILSLYIVEPTLKLFRWSQRQEDAWTKWLNGTQTQRAPIVDPLLEDLL